MNWKFFTWRPLFWFIFIFCTSIIGLKAECGKTRANIKGVISGNPENKGGSPWHVAVYDITHTKPELICGGTIITSRIIITAAHCFFDFVYGSSFHNASNYEIMVAKYTLDYTTKDSAETKTYKIRKIFSPNELVEYTGDSTSYAGDISLLWIDGELKFSEEVLPACVNWTETGCRFLPSNNVKGKLVGWGPIKENSQSPVLRALFLPHINYTTCRHVVNEDFANSLPLDKFCAGEKKGAGEAVPGPGDGGSGLLFPDTKSDPGLYYLRGIVSNKDSETNNIVACTDLTQYIGWINDKRKQIDDEVMRLKKGILSKL